MCKVHDGDRPHPNYFTPGILYSLCLHRRVYSNGALENNIIKLDTINTQAFVLPPRNPACKALTCRQFDGRRPVGGHGSRPAAEAESDCRSYRHARTEQYTNQR